MEVNQTDFTKLMNRITEAEEEIQRLSYTLDRVGIRLGSTMSFKGSTFELNGQRFQQWEAGSNRPLTDADKYIKIENGTLTVRGGGIDLTSSDGYVKLDDDGIKMTALASYTNTASLKWYDSTNLAASIYGMLDVPTDHSLRLECARITGESSSIFLSSVAGASKASTILSYVQSSGAWMQWGGQIHSDLVSDENHWSIFWNDGSLVYTPFLVKPLDEMIIMDANITANHNFQYSGDLKPYRNSTAYTGYAYVPLAAPLTSTSWDGDAKTSANNGNIDVVSVFGVPSGTKAVFAQLTVGSNTVGNYANLGYSSTYPSYVGQVVQLNNKTIVCEGIVTLNGNNMYFACNGGAGTEVTVYIRILGYWI